jgi:serine/threonine protein kinase
LSTCRPLSPSRCSQRTTADTFANRYLVVDLMSGGDLRFHISRKTFTEEAVRFWIAELGCAIRYIHGQNIIHRDIKPDNVLLDADGHVHLTDFVCPAATLTPTDHQLTPLIECCFRCGTWEGVDQQVRYIGVSCARSVLGSRLRCPGRLVVIGRFVLRVHLQQGLSFPAIVLGVPPKSAT